VSVAGWGVGLGVSVAVAAQAASVRAAGTSQPVVTLNPRVKLRMCCARLSIVSAYDGGNDALLIHPAHAIVPAVDKVKVPQRVKSHRAWSFDGSGEGGSAIARETDHTGANYGRNISLLVDFSKAVVTAVRNVKIALSIQGYPIQTRELSGDGRPAVA
jgi:hypothetical protein